VKRLEIGLQAGAAGRIGSGDGQCHGRHAVTRITRKGSEGASAWIPRPHKAVIEDEWNHRPHGYSREAGMLWVQQIVMFEGNNCGANLKNRRSTRVDPSVAELFRFSNTASEIVSAMYTTDLPGEFHRPPTSFAPSPSRRA
jgi:hypothetical protein